MFSNVKLFLTNDSKGNNKYDKHDDDIPKLCNRYLISSISYEQRFQ